MIFEIVRVVLFTTVTVSLSYTGACVIRRSVKESSDDGKHYHGISLENVTGHSPRQGPPEIDPLNIICVHCTCTHCMTSK